MVNDSSKKNHSGKVTPTFMVPCNYQLNTILNLRWRESQWLSNSSWPFAGLREVVLTELIEEKRPSPLWAAPFPM